MLNTITVSQLNTYVKSLIENDVRLMNVSVSGEISNYKYHFSSGHWYFTLKDQNASIRCVMFRSSAARVKFSVTDGLAVTLRGRVSLYEKDGQYQFYAEEMHANGEGDLALAFKQVKEKLESEGLFEPDNKRQLVKFPKRIAVITSDTGAAVKDILNITSSRYPSCEIVMCPVLVQGDMAALDMRKTLDRVYTLDDIDTIIIGRGGGSAEDLHCFNDEALARKIYESPFPVISAVGHETDFTICDFVADVRASTPSHAAELAVPDSRDLKNHISSMQKILTNKALLRCNFYDSRLKIAKSKVSRQGLQQVVQNKQMELDRITDRVMSGTKQRIQEKENSLMRSIARIDALSPLKVMARGFSVVTKQDKCVTNVSHLDVGDAINVSLSDGSIDCTVTNINKKAEV
ncbi:MAG: exodeoxyribonuclease VII large subunit [Clostridia bacterium]|nr:exodeoxyribonuclease VII large subunit [Clostridia bacterium]